MSGIFIAVGLAALLFYGGYKIRPRGKREPIVCTTGEIENVYPVGTKARIIALNKRDWRYSRRADYEGNIVTLVAKGTWLREGYTNSTVLPHATIELL